MENCLAQVRNLLNQLELKGDGPRIVTRPESVEEVVVGDGDGEAEIDNTTSFILYHTFMT